MSGDVIIEMREVAVPFRRNSEIATVEGMNWTVRAGEFWIVGGPQGSGKSDLVFMLAGLTKPLRGSYTLYGRDMAARFGDEFAESRRRVGMVFDDSRLLNHLTLSDNIALPVRYHHDLHAVDADEWVGELMRATGVEEYAGNTPSTVAWHWRRRAALARALSLRPEVLFLENPLRGLDARQVRWWLNFLAQLDRGHELMRGRPTTIVATADEFRPWAEVKAHFASLNARQFTVTGETMPSDDVPLSPVVAGEGI